MTDIVVQAPDGSTVSFPAGTDEATMHGVMSQHFGGAKFGSDEYIGAMAQKYGADPQQVRARAESQMSSEGVKGIPILGGLADKAGAGISALAQPLTGAGAPGATLGERYGKNLALDQQLGTDFEREHPALSTAAGVIGGTAATGGLGLTSLGARLLGLTGGTLPGMIWRGAASGAGINAADAAVRGGNPLSAATIGGGVGAAVPVVGRALSAVAQPAMTAIRGIRDPAAEASRRVAGAIDRDINAGAAGLTPQDFVAARNAGTPVNLMDVGGETTRALARSAANTSPEGRAVLNKAIDDRFEGQSQRLTDWLQSTFHYPDAAAQQGALDQVAKGANKTAYDLAAVAAENRHPQGVWSPELERLTSSPDVVDAMKSAAQRGAGRAVAEGYGGFNPGVTFENGIMKFRTQNGMPQYPDLRFWDYTLRNIRDQADAAFRAGRNSEGSALKAQSNALRGELDNLVPEFGQARAGAARFFGANDALEAGQNFVSSRMENNAARVGLSKMSPLERQLFQDGFVDRFVKQIRESPDRRSALNQIAQSPAARERLNIALGPQRAKELEATLRVEGIMDTARSAVQGNSTTARQLAELGLAGGAYTLGTGGNIFNPDPTAIMNAALVYGAARGGRALTSTIDTRVANQVARLLTSNDVTKLNTGIKLLSRNQGAMGAIRNTDAALAGIAARGMQPALTYQ